MYYKCMSLVSFYKIFFGLEGLEGLKGLEVSSKSLFRIYLRKNTVKQ